MQLCSGGNVNGNAVTVGAEQTFTTGGSTTKKGPAPTSNSAARPDTRPEDMSYEEKMFRAGWVQDLHGEWRKFESPAEPGNPDEPATPTEPRTVTLVDLKNFSPSSGKERSEPRGWTAVGLNTNFIADGGVQVRTGMLLGQPAAVRFTPAGYHWNYGDGTDLASTTAGATWKALGLNEFDKTPTSHIFAEPGTYTVTLAIEYTAEYRFADSAWLPVAGTVQDSPAPMTIAATTANTVLVDKNCASNPKGPGC